jgi:hypothetical protein
MKIARVFSFVALIPFTALTAYALWEMGYVGVLSYQLATSGGQQVLMDLTIACTFFLIWMFQDAKKTGRNPWGYLVVTLIAASFGPLLYFALSKAEAE